jgi:prepilin-type N-terminal cleavage/methylation domain-containing protein
MDKLIKQAFTLIELLVVIAIIGILSGLIVVSMSGVTDKANLAKAQVFSNSLRNSLMTNTIGEWKFDDGAGQTATDSWGGVNNGTLGSAVGTDTNDPTWVTSGCLYSNCLSFDGINDYVNCGNNSSLNSLGSITISAWINTNSLTTQQTIWGSGVYRLSFGSTLGGGGNVKTVGFTETSVAVWTLTADNVLTNGWTHVVYSKNGPGATSSIYLNGKKQTLAANSSFTLANSGSTSLGAFNGGIPMNGLMDEVRLYNVAVPTSQIQEQYYTGLNDLFINGGISREEYAQKIGEAKLSVK